MNVVTYLVIKRYKSSIGTIKTTAVGGGVLATLLILLGPRTGFRGGRGPVYGAGPGTGKAAGAGSGERRTGSGAGEATRPGSGAA